MNFQNTQLHLAGKRKHRRKYRVRDAPNSSAVIKLKQYRSKRNKIPLNIIKMI